MRAPLVSSPSAGHDAASTGSDARNRPKTFLTAVLCGFAALLPIVGVVAPKGLVILLLLAAVLAVPSYWLAHRRFPVPDLRIAIALAALVVWCAIASSWGLDASRSLVLALRIAVILAAGLVLFPIAAALDDAARARVGQWLVGGFALILALAAVEIGLGFPLLRAYRGDGAEAGLVWFNRGAVAMALIAWPVTAYLWKRRIGWKALFVPVALGVASYFLESAAATLGFAVGVATLLLVVCHRRIGRVATIAASALVFVGAPFAAWEMHDRGWHRADWLTGSAQHRVQIWNFSAERIVEKPLLGWGFDNSRHIGGRFAESVAAGREAMPLHPHNAPLQIVLELGAVGGVIALALLWLVALRLDTLPLRTRMFAQALFVAALAIGCVAFGLWQNWWLALVVSVAVLVPLSAAPAAPKGASLGR